MKILKLQGENIKRMEAFEIDPKGNVVVISGENGQGKTSILDSIVLALAGKSSDVAKLTTKPIKEGAKTAQVTVTTEEYVITRTWTEKDSYLEMTSRDGLVYKSPQAMLDQMIGDLSFDPLEFTRMKPKDQRDSLLGIVKLDINLEEWERDFKLKYDTRTSVGNQGKALKGKLETTPESPPDTPEEEVSIVDLVTQKDEAEKRNRAIETMDDGIAGNDKLIEQMRAKLAELEKTQEENRALRAKMGDKVDTSALQQKIASAEDINRAVRVNKERAAIAADMLKYDAEYDKLTAELEAMQKNKAEKLETAKFPIAGLSFADDGVTYKGIPLPQCSAAEQLKVSMAIAMAKNPKLRVIRIVDGSLLDEKNMKVIQEMADKNDFQIWVEVVDSSGKVGIVISEGKVVADNSKAAA